MSTLARRLLIAAAVVALLAVIGGLIFVVPNLGDDDAATDAADPATTSAPTPAPSAPGSVDNGRTGFGTPVVDILGRKVTVPNNPVGAPLPQEQAGERSGCGTAGPLSSPTGVQIQQTVGLPTLVSTSDGPTRINGNVLTGYSRTPQGAALAGWNWIGRVYGPGPVAKDAYEKLTVATDELAQKSAGETWEGEGLSGSSFPAPEAFRIVSCTDDFASVEYAINIPIDDNGQRRTTPAWTVMRASLFHDSGEWRARLDGRSVSATPDVTSIAGFTPWTLS